MVQSDLRALTLDGSPSYDPDSLPVSWLWTCTAVNITDGNSTGCSSLVPPSILQSAGGELIAYSSSLVAVVNTGVDSGLGNASSVHPYHKGRLPLLADRD